MPDPAQPQSFNRYSYTLNNPVKYVDVTGHYTCESAEQCSPPTATDSRKSASLPQVVTFSGEETFSPTEQATIEAAAIELGRQYASHIDRQNRNFWKFGLLSSFSPTSATNAFRSVHGGAVSFVGTITTPSAFLGERTGRGEITVNLTYRTGISQIWALHELGHDFNAQAGGQPYKDLASEGLYVDNEQFAGNTNAGYLRTFLGFKSDSFPDV